MLQSGPVQTVNSSDCKQSVSLLPVSVSPLHSPGCPFSSSCSRLLSHYPCPVTLKVHLCFLGLRISLLVRLSCRMLQLSLSWLGLGPVAVSLWQLLLLVGTSLFLARVLTWICALYDNYCRLRCFPQPPFRHWFWGHMSMVSVAAVGLECQDECVLKGSGKALRNLGVMRGPGPTTAEM